MSKPLDLIGQRFGRLVVTKKASNHVSPCGHTSHRFIAMCDCGLEITVFTGSLKSGNTQSCGCWKIEKAVKTGRGNNVHGHAGANKSPEYSSWRAMNTRCYNSNATGYDRYGGRGITVCKEWRDDFTAFLADMGERPSLDYSLDRKENDKGYSKSNCRWATKLEQTRNRRPRSQKICKEPIHIFSE